MRDDSMKALHDWAHAKLVQTLRQVAALLEADAESMVEDATERRIAARRVRAWL